MTKILFILMDSRFGGPQKRLLLQRKYFQKYGMNTVIGVPFFDEVFDRECIKYTQPYKLFSIWKPRKSFIGCLASLLALPKFIFRLCGEFQKDDCDFVMAHGSLSIQVILSAKISRKKVIWFLNDTIFNTQISNLIRLIYSPFVDVTLVQGKELIRHFGLRRNTFSLLSPVFNIADKPRSLNRHSVINIGLLANISPIKDIKLFIYVAQKLLENPIQFHFILQGAVLESQKHYYAEVIDLISKKGLEEYFSILDFNTNVEPFFNKIDIFLLTSKSEASPNVVSESMARGIPVVSTNVGSVSEMLNINNKHFCGLVSNTHSANDLSKLVKEIVIDNNLYSQLSINGLMSASRDLSPETLPKLISNINN